MARVLLVGYDPARQTLLNKPLLKIALSFSIWK
jgi:hypothetical protein